MAILKVIISFIVIGLMENFVKFKDKNDERCFEIAMSILMAGWIFHSGWL